MSNPQRSIRLLGRPESSLNRISRSAGELFYDTTNQALRIYHKTGSSTIATEDYVDTAVNNIDLSSIDLSGLNLTGYATETYVTTRGYITSSALSSYALTSALSSYALTSALSSYALTSAIPTNTNQLTNGAGFITSSALSSYALTSAIPTNTNQLTNGAGFITSSALSSYALTSAIPTNTNQLTNGANYITSSSLNGLATETYVGTAISNLIDTAPTTLNTLNELAAALNDDANFATTVTTALGDKAPINNPTFTGTVGGVTKAMVGLGNVTNESKATMFTNPTFTGTVSGLPPATLPTNPVIAGLLTFEPPYDATLTIDYPFASFIYNSDIDDYVIVWGGNSVQERSILPFLEVGQALTISVYSSSTGTTSNIGPYLVYGIVSSVDSMNPFMTNYQVQFGPGAQLPVDNTSSIAAITVPYTATIGGYEIRIGATLVTRSSTEMTETQTVYTENVYDFARANTWLVTEPTSTSLTLKNIPGFPYNVGRATVMTLVITQGVNPIIPGANESFIVINDYPAPLKWLGGTVPTGTASGVDIVSYAIAGFNILASVSSYS